MLLYSSKAVLAFLYYGRCIRGAKGSEEEGKDGAAGRKRSQVFLAELSVSMGLEYVAEVLQLASRVSS